MTRNPVIVIPGVLGSKLVAEGDARSVWGEWRPGFQDPATDDGARLIGLPMAPGLPLDALRSGSRPDGALGVVRGAVAGVNVAITAYGDVMSAMGVGSYAGSYVGAGPETGTAAFEFSYDWRRSLDECAIALEAFVHRARRFLQVQRNSSEPIRFDVVAHSMGGLVLRYFLQFGGRLLPLDGAGPRLDWAGAAHVDKALIIGTPNAGSLKMVDRLIRGIPGNPLHPWYGAVLVGTFPSGYQLLPRRRHGPLQGAVDAADDPLEIDFWRSRDWGLTASWLDAERAVQLPGVASAAERLHIAEDHLAKCLLNARIFQTAMDTPLDALPPSLQMHLFTGVGQRTPSQLTPARDGRGVRWTRYAPGDGTVLASSVRLEEPDARSPVPWTSVTTLRSSHMGLLKDRVLLDRMQAILRA